MHDKCTSDNCVKPLKPGDSVIQLTTGKYISGYTTPYLTPEETHIWHPECFHEFQLKDQFAPYSCVKCSHQIENNDLVVYVCHGTMPNRGYFRAESRGQTLLYIAHIDCKKKLLGGD
jgi:hypothetical protein